jgi:aldose sugar dehydrogenase
MLNLRRAVLMLFMLLMVASLNAQNDVFTDAPTGVQYVVERYMLADFPVGMVFTPDGRLLYNEKTTGNVRIISADGKRAVDPVLHLPTDALQERGMLGIELDPDFATNHYVYVMHTRVGDARRYAANELVRFTLEGDTGVDPVVLFSVPIETGDLLHNGGNVHFGPDGYLYLSLGDYGEAAFGQDLSVPQAKIHRFAVAEDGTLSPAPDNPFGDDNSAWAYGLRNAFDFTFDPVNGNLFAAEVGPDCDDEIDLVLPGFNYGWREDYECVGKGVITGLAHPYAQPLLTFTPVEAPTGIIFYEGDAFPEWQGNLFFCNWIFGNLRRVVLDERRTQVVEVHEIDMGDNECRLDLVVGPDGGLYFGSVGDFGGAILRLLPAK